MSDIRMAGVGLTLHQKHRPFPTWEAEMHGNKDYAVGVADNTIEPGRRLHIAGVFDRDEVRLYLNGRLQSIRFPTDGYRASGLPFLIGAKPDPPTGSDSYSLVNSFDGVVREVHISRMARYTTAFEPADRFQTDGDTIVLYHCDEGRGDVLRDASPNRRHGKIKGARWVPADQPVAVIPPPSPTVIDLLPLIDPERDQVKGKWQRTRDSVTLVQEPLYARLELPYRPPDEYDLRLDFTPTGSIEGITPCLLGNGRQFRCEFGASKNTSVSLNVVNGTIYDNPTLVKKDAWLSVGRRHEVVMQVRRDQVRAYLDGVLVLLYRTDYKNLSLKADGLWDLRDTTILGLGAYQPTTFHKVEGRRGHRVRHLHAAEDLAAKNAAEARSAVWRPLCNGRNFDGWSFSGRTGNAAEFFSLGRAARRGRSFGSATIALMRGCTRRTDGL